MGGPVAELCVKRMPKRENKGLLSFSLEHRHMHTFAPTPLHTSLYTRSIDTYLHSTSQPVCPPIELHREIPLYPKVLKVLWEKPRKSGGRRVGGWGGRLYLPEKKAQRAGPLPFPSREENTRRKPPGKTEGLGELNRF